MLPSPELKARRTAAYALNLFTREVAGIGSAERVFFDSEQDDEWAVLSLYEVKAIKRNKLVALVELWGGRAVISLAHPDLLFRGKAREVNYLDYGFHPPAYDGMGKMQPWVMPPIELPDDIPGINSKQRKVPRQPRAQRVNVRRQL